MVYLFHTSLAKLVPRNSKQIKNVLWKQVQSYQMSVPCLTFVLGTSVVPCLQLISC